MKSITNKMVPFIITVILCIFFGFHWSLQSSMDEILNLFIFPLILGFFALWISVYYSSSWIWIIPFFIVIIREVITTFIYGSQVGFHDFTYTATQIYLIAETGYNLIMIYILFSIGRSVIYFWKKK